MSASNEENIQHNSIDPKTAREAQQRKAEKRSNALYATIAVVFVLVAAAAIIWRSNIIPRTVTAVNVNGEKYTAAELNFYYQNAYQNFLNTYSDMLSYVGLNPNKPLESQNISDETAELMGLEKGGTWHDFFMDQALTQIATVQAVLEEAETNGFTYPASVQTQYDDSMAALEETAKASGVSAQKYIQTNLGAVMTEKIYWPADQSRMLQYGAYVDAVEQGMTYTSDELEAAYAKAPNNYDLVSCEIVSISGAAESTTDADGKTVPPTDEEKEAAKAAAKKAADEMLAAYRSGKDLKALAEANEKASYHERDDAAYSGDAVTEWLFDDARKAGDSSVVESGGSTYYVVVYYDRFRDEYDTINVRHILIAPEMPELSKEDEGYEDEVAKLKAEAVTKAEDLLAEWKAGEATEDSFAALAMEHSADGSKYDGGLYTQVYEGQMVPAFNDWCFDDSRKAGDTDVVETNYGAHVMYFSGKDLPRWETLVTSDLRTEDLNAWFQEMSTKYTAEQSSFGVRFVG